MVSDRRVSASGQHDRVIAIARALTAAFLVAMAVVVVYVVAARFSFPGELEWMAGSIVDHVERVQHGEPVYAPPSADWIPFIYTPGYYWVAAAFAHAMPLVPACRLVSILSSLMAAFCTYFLARGAGATRYLAGLAPLLFVGCFGYVCAWYDVERSDALLVAVLAVAAVVLQRWTSLGAAAASGALVGLAFFVKQPASMFIAVVPVVLVLARQTKRALAFAAGAVVGLVPLLAWLQASTKGWFWFYCVKEPSAHGMAAKYITMFFVADLSKALVLTIATFGAVAWLVATARDRLAARDVSVDQAKIVLAAFVVAGFVASGTSRMHVGGWPNVLVFWTTFAVPAVSVLVTRLESIGSRAVTCAALAAVALQAGAFVTDPNDAVPDHDALAATEDVSSRVAAFEKSGDVLVLGRGHVTRRRHPHINALVDLIRAGNEPPSDLRDKIAERQFAAIVLDDMDDIRMKLLLGHESELFAIVTRSYFVAECFDDRAPMPVVGYPTRPRWVLRPRRTPLALDHDALLARQYVEMGLAEANMRAAQGNPSRRSDGLDIEERAAGSASP